ncbi:MAG: hypothetical protein FD123_3857 [Bacteroidetes bacterium]|nr:MAG: hypothetical protein FD123_3857 [Bacteroidota bacterium]
METSPAPVKRCAGLVVLYLCNVNFLAHLYLSGNDDTELLIGNFIADAVTGPEAKTFPPGVQRGIRLHLSIDHFTDTHPVVEKTKARLRPKFHKYAPVISDVFYDHFLAAGWKNYSAVSLKNYADHVYNLLAQNENLLPEFTKKMLPHMKRENWLLYYATLEGMHGIFLRMSRRTKFESHMEEAAEALKQDYDSYRQEFELFFPELQRHCADFLKTP